MTDLKVVDLASAGVNLNVVEALEHWLENARSGELQAIALAGINVDGASVTRSSGTEQSRGPVTQQALLGALTYMTYRLSKTIDEND